MGDAARGPKGTHQGGAHVFLLLFVALFSFVCLGGTQAAYGFHSLRERKPWLTAGRLANQSWYSFFSCNTGEWEW